MAERLLNHINETIRDQEGADTLKKISQFLWVGEGYVFPRSNVLADKRNLFSDGLI